MQLMINQLLQFKDRTKTDIYNLQKQHLTVAFSAKSQITDATNNAQSN